ncbi:MAG: DUF2309 domain-containing protein, partial [Rickettsiales bacterium]|nr:DUF2309 domain-containing protein [Rickettsiales bacterium]
MSQALKNTATASRPGASQHSALQDGIARGWDRIAPFWPLESLVAVNPLQGFENLAFEEALSQGEAYFQHDHLPAPMEAVNRETIKWMQLFCDEGQATLPMPGRAQGLYAAWRALAPLDACLHRGDARAKARLAALPESPEAAISESALKLGLAPEQYEPFFTLLLTTLPGWAAYLKYRTDWASKERHRHPATKEEYLALRLSLLCVLWPEAKQLLDWHSEQCRKPARWTQHMQAISANESRYRQQLLQQLTQQDIFIRRGTPKAQLVFCIDVRSEPFRRALEGQGYYQTFGFAGFFGIPVDIRQDAAEENHACCPVLLKPRHQVREVPAGDAAECEKDRTGLARLRALLRHYQSAKYTFTAPLALMETLGVGAGAWMGLRSFAPSLAARLKSQLSEAIRPVRPTMPLLDGLSLAEKCA